MSTQWHRFAIRWQGGREHEDPLAVRPLVRFQHKSGAERIAEAFWNGGRTWEVRFSPDLSGRWVYQLQCAEGPALDRQSGSFECGTAETNNPLHRVVAFASLSRDGDGSTRVSGPEPFYFSRTKRRWRFGAGLPSRGRRANAAFGVAATWLAAPCI